MRWLWAVTAFALLAAPNMALASDLTITNVAVEGSNDPAVVRARLTIDWKNSWRNERNYDAAWIVLKVRARR